MLHRNSLFKVDAGSAVQPTLLPCRATIMLLFSRGHLRIAILTSFILTLTTLCSFCQNPHPLTTQKALFDRLDLTEQQCRSTFPLQYTFLDNAIARGPFAFHPSPSDYKGLVQARIINNTVRCSLPTATHAI
jgi:hypothetical protein